MIDIHSHIAWDIDDGMPCQEDAIEALKMAKNDGIECICSTPHIVCGQTTISHIEQIRLRQSETKELAKQFGIQLAYGCEMFMNRDFVSYLKDGLFVTLNGSHYLLCEFDVRRDIHMIEDFDEYLYEIKMNHMIPCIAHVERYFKNGLDYDILDRWKNAGYVMQVNRTSLMGLHGKTVKKNAWNLLLKGYAHVVASDCHRCEGERVEVLSDIKKIIEKKFGEEYADLLVKENPMRILNDQEVIEMKPKKKGFFWGI